MAARTAVAGFGIAIVIAAVALGVYAIGSPVEQRARSFDERRVGALRNLEPTIDEYWRVRGRLPQSIAEVMRDRQIFTETKDPSSGQEYRYRVVSERMYQLCAEFARSSAGISDQGLWAHPSGPYCFDLNVIER